MWNIVISYREMYFRSINVPIDNRTSQEVIHCLGVPPLVWNIWPLTRFPCVPSARSSPYQLPALTTITSCKVLTLSTTTSAAMGHGSDSRQGLMQPPLSSVSSPEQAPGTEHVLFLVCRPSPHVVLQDCWDQVDHSTFLMKTKLPWKVSIGPLFSPSSLYTQFPFCLKECQLMKKKRISK